MAGHEIAVVASFESARMAVEINRGQLEHAIIRLVLRARTAMATGGTLRIEAATEMLEQTTLPPGSGLAPGTHVVVRISDSGPTLPPEELARIFEPVSTVATLSQGTWLGLADVFGLIASNGGAITAEAAPERGTMFKIYLPPAAN
jgi:signal transduction histidine kinase